MSDKPFIKNAPLNYNTCKCYRDALPCLNTVMLHGHTKNRSFIRTKHMNLNIVNDSQWKITTDATGGSSVNIHTFTLLNELISKLR